MIYLVTAFSVSVALWFFFYLWNHSDICASARTRLDKVLNRYVAYSIGCAFCSSFWVMFLSWSFELVPFIFLFFVPVFSLFIDLTYRNLTRKLEPPRVTNLNKSAIANADKGIAIAQAGDGAKIAVINDNKVSPKDYPVAYYDNMR